MILHTSFSYQISTSTIEQKEGKKSAGIPSKGEETAAILITKSSCPPGLCLPGFAGCVNY